MKQEFFRMQQLAGLLTEIKINNPNKPINLIKNLLDQIINICEDIDMDIENFDLEDFIQTLESYKDELTEIKNFK